MAKLLVKSEDQILGSMARLILARTGLNDLNPGSILLTLLQAAAQEDFAQYYQMLQIIRNYNLDTTTGTDLDNRAFEFGLVRKTAAKATGKVKILREEGFTKIASSFYTGFRSRIAGDTELFLNDASDFPTSGTNTLIIGRNTPNEEEVTYIGSGTNPLDQTNYFKITLSSPITNDHALDEEVVLKQGSDIVINAGTIISVPASGKDPEKTFSVTSQVSILAGEDFVDDVDVKATLTGVDAGNIAAFAIEGTEAFTNPPSVGLRAQNEASFTTGQDRETDTKLRNRIKNFIQALTQSTKAGISNAIQGLVDTTTAKRVISSNVIIPNSVAEPVKIYIDDGTGFEPSFQSQGQEVILNAAKGGEVRLQLDLFPLVKAQIETGNPEPWDFSSGTLTLVVNVGNESETLQFFTSDFTIPEAATAEEIVSAINNQATLVEARTSQIGKDVVLAAKSDTNEDIQITGGTANSASLLNFITSQVFTFYLYKNDVLLSKDGQTAFIDSATGPFDFSGPDQDLLVIVDGKTANEQTVTISESDFASPAAAASALASEVAAIINDQLAGATSFDVNGKVRLVSNQELTSKSKIKLNASDAATTLGFSLTQVVGKDQDYTLNPELGVIELNEALVANDRITAGTRNTRAFLTASLPAEYTLAGGETLEIIVDGGSPQTVTFTAQVNGSAQQIADQVNTQLIGGTAVVRTVGSDDYLEIRTNTLDEDVGSIEITSSSTGNSIFEFLLDTEITNIVPHTAYQVSGTSGPWAFIEGQTLVVVLDNDPSGKTFVITMDFDGTVTTGTSTTIFAASAYSTVFTSDDELIDFWAVAKSGDNTITGTVGEVSNPTGSTFRYFYDAPPLNFEDFAAGDQASFSDMTEAGNNGNFLVTATVVQNTVHAAVLDRDLDNPSVLTPSVGDRYLIAATAGTALASAVLDKDLDTPPGGPSPGDRYIVAPTANDTTLASVKDTTIVDSALATATHGFRYVINGVGLNDWAGHDFEIAEYNGVGVPGWVFTTPNDDDVVFSDAQATFYQFDNGGGTWLANAWGGSAGRIAEYNGSIWVFTSPVDNEVRTVTDEALIYQYDSTSNLWTQNDWGSFGNQIAQWGGSSWTFTAPSTNDVVDVTDEIITVQYNGSSWVEFRFWVEVTNTSGETESGSAGTGLIGQRRQITDYTSTGTITVGAAFRDTFAPSDTFVVLPGDKENVRDFFNNTRVTSLSGRAFIELAEQATKIQISSKLNGSDGYVKVSGGKANDLLLFSTTQVQGLQAYSYYTGLVKLVHKTIYGDEQDLVSFPGVGAAGIKFQILAPTVEEISFALEVTLADGVSISTLENDIKSAITSYVKSLGVGETVILEEVKCRVMDVNGVIDVEMTTPLANVVIAQNELARTKASLISVVQAGV